MRHGNESMPMKPPKGLSMGMAQPMPGWPGMKNYPHAVGIRHNSKSMKVGGGGRFAKLKAEIAAKGDVRDPGAVAAMIGRKKYGGARMAKMAAAGRRRAS